MPLTPKRASVIKSFRPSVLSTGRKAYHANPPPIPVRSMHSLAAGIRSSSRRGSKVKKPKSHATHFIRALRATQCSTRAVAKLRA